MNDRLSPTQSDVNRNLSYSAKGLMAMDGLKYLPDQIYNHVTGNASIAQ